MSESIENKGQPVGDFFLTFHANGLLDKQGQVICSPQPSFYLCQMFSFMTGFPTNRVLVPVSECVRWRFYSSESEWRAAGEAEVARSREAIKAEMEGSLG